MGQRNLVVVRAGDSSLHPGWTQDLATRDWDLVVSYFGADVQRFRGPGEQRIDDRGQKFEGLHALFMRDPRWRDYDHVWLPDDDLATDQRTISALFAHMGASRFAVAQPSLAWTSYYSYNFTLHHPSFAVRATNFVEVMAPCFQAAFLAHCLPTFTENLSGWGLDYVWPKMLPEGRPLAGIIDAVQVEHTRAVGGPSYARLAAQGRNPLDEFRALMQKFAIPWGTSPRVLAAIEQDHTVLSTSVAAQAERIRDLLARDGAAMRVAIDAAGMGDRRATPAT